MAGEWRCSIRSSEEPLLNFGNYTYCLSMMLSGCVSIDFDVITESYLCYDLSEISHK